MFCYHSLIVSYIVDFNLIEGMLIIVGFIAMNLVMAREIVTEAMMTVQVTKINLVNYQLEQQLSSSLLSPSR